MTVKFTSADEFIADLRADGGLVERNILRVTHSWRFAPPLTTLSVLATAVVGGQLVVLECRCGSYMFGDGPDGKETHDRAEMIMGKLRDLAAELKLEVRPGVFEAA